MTKRTLEEKRAIAKEFTLAMAKRTFAESDYYAKVAKERAAMGLFYTARAEAAESADEALLDLMIAQWVATYEADEANHEAADLKFAERFLVNRWMRLPPKPADPPPDTKEEKP